MGEEDTTRHLRRAREGETTSLDWIVRRFTPLLLAQARYRISKSLKGKIDPEDLVAEAWAATLPKLSTLEPRDGRLTPVVVRFLSTAVLNCFNRAAERLIRRRENVQGDAAPPTPVQDLADSTRGVITEIASQERRDVISQALDSLSAEDREIVVLRGIEQNKPALVATLLGISANLVAKRYARALERLHKALGPSVFDDFATD